MQYSQFNKAQLEAEYQRLNEEYKEIPIEETLLEGIEPWNIKKICHSETKK